MPTASAGTVHDTPADAESGRGFTDELYWLEECVNAPDVHREQNH
jgi:hypothetical protein